MQSFPSEILADIKKHLEGEKKKLEGQIAELAAQDPFSDPERANDNAASDTDAKEEASHDRFAAMGDELKAKTAAIDGALARIADGTYGFCTNCKQMIDTDRLAILPTATLCLSCETSKKK